MFNKQFPKASRFTEWALKKAPEKMDVVEFEGTQYHEFTKLSACNLGKRAAPIYAEIGTKRVYLVNTELHQVWIEKVGCYVSDYGRLRVGEVRFTVAACCRCKAELDDRESALMAACEDCLNDVDTDPEALLFEFANGDWG